MDISFKTDNEKFNHRVCAMIISDGKILAMHNERTPYYYLPGGRVKIGEAAENAVIREIREELGAYDFSQLFIDERYQGKGFGYAAASKIIEIMKADGKFNKAILCYIEGNESAKKLYEKIGFFCTGERDGDEIIMQMNF